MSTETIVPVHHFSKALPRWTGFSNKTLWDWLHLCGLLAIPLAVILGSILFSLQQREIGDQQQQVNLAVAKAQQQEAILDDYLNRMTPLLINDNLGNARPTDLVCQIARDWTMATLLRLDPLHKAMVVQFLYQSNLIMRDNVRVSLSGADLSGIRLQGVNLQGADLSGINLSGADLTGANLGNTDLSNTNMHHTILPNGSVNP
jgi:uncharacterized protein YjbI with pentapeptide repeats